MNPSPTDILRAAHEALLGRRDLDAVGEFFAAGYVAHGTDRNLPGGHRAIREFLDALHQAFPDLRYELEILVEQGDRVAWQRTLEGTHQAAFKGFPPTGRPLRWRDMVTSRIVDGRIAEDWLITDLAERLLLARKR